jgi:hypothetical protein
VLRKSVVAAALVASGAVGCTHALASRVAAPLQCRASGLWILERHHERDAHTAWVTLAMAPWETWKAGFQLSDGRGGSLTLRVSDVSRDEVALTANQAEQDRRPSVFTRGSTVGCAFYAVDDVESYRFRRQR